MKKRYFLKDDGQEINMGDTVKLSLIVDTSYGKGIAQVNVVADETVLKQLIDDGLVVSQDELSFSFKDFSEFFDGVKPYLEDISTKIGITTDTCLMGLSVIAMISQGAHLCILIQLMANECNKNTPEEDIYYWLNPLAEYRPCQLVEKCNGIPIFYSFEGALKAYTILSPLLNNVINGK